MKVIVFDIGGTSIKYGICNDGILTQSHETPTKAALGGRHIMDMVKSILFTEAGFHAIGISTAGQVDSENGSIIYANSNIPDYTGTQIKKEFEELFHVPVIVENDVNAAAIGEAAYGAGRNQESFLCLTYGTGVGGAIIQNGKVYHGSTFSAGEFGGIVTHGTVRQKGNDVFDGCYERYASTTALVNAAEKLDPLLTNGRLIFENLHKKEVKDVIDSWIDEIILGLTSIIHIFNPSCIVLGGGIMAQSYIIEEINHRLPSQIMSSFSNVKIVQAVLGNSAGMLGINYLAEKYAKRPTAP